jgi:hypothetical protein
MERERSNKRTTDSSYVQQMGRVLRTKDVNALREFLVKSANDRNDSGEAAELEGIPQADLESRMHKMIMARADLAGMHDSSREWLVGHGFEPIR